MISETGRHFAHMRARAVVNRSLRYGDYSHACREVQYFLDSAYRAETAAIPSQEVVSFHRYIAHCILELIQ